MMISQVCDDLNYMAVSIRMAWIFETPIYGDFVMKVGLVLSRIFPSIGSASILEVLKRLLGLRQVPRHVHLPKHVNGLGEILFRLLALHLNVQQFSVAHVASG